MELTDDASAIDDSYEPVRFQRVQRAAPHLAGQALIKENLGYNGPRFGHWIVESTVVGSAIDDRSPTVHRSPNASYNSTGYVHPLSGGVAGRLAKATEAERRRDEMITAESNINTSQRQLQGEPEEQPRPPIGFYLPKNDRRGIRITRKNGQNEVVRPPQVLPASPTVARRDEPTRPKDCGKVKEPSPSPSPPMSKKAASVESHASRQSKRVVRIASKQGEELFVELPIIQSSPLSAPRPSPHAKVDDNGVSKEQAVDEEKKAKLKQEANAGHVAKRLREERLLQAQVDQQQAEEAKVAAEAIMSGALPASLKAGSSNASVLLRSVTPSGQSSKLALGGILGDTPKPRSVASSKTSLTPPKKALSGRSRVVSNHDGSSQRFEEPSISGWQEIGHGGFRATALQSRHSGRDGVRRPNKPTPVHSARGGSIIPDINNVHSQEAADLTSYHSIRKSSSLGEWRKVTPQDLRGDRAERKDGSERMLERTPTVYAGRGWISPHPLSIPPCGFEEPPDEAIIIPGRKNTREGATMTFDEWKSLHSGDKDYLSRNDFSRSSRAEGAFPATSWGHLAVETTETVRPSERQISDGHRVVESEQSNQTYEHAFDGVKDVDGDGQTYLRMPWDNGVDW